MDIVHYIIYICVFISIISQIAHCWCRGLPSKVSFRFISFNIIYTYVWVFCQPHFCKVVRLRLDDIIIQEKNSKAERRHPLFHRLLTTYTGATEYHRASACLEPLFHFNREKKTDQKEDNKTNLNLMLLTGLE